LEPGGKRSFVQSDDRELRRPFCTKSIYSTTNSIVYFQKTLCFYFLFSSRTYIKAINR
jgi:hypothetical protein